jgi:hypothetical protein
MAEDNDDERYGELIPPSRRGKVSRMYDGSRALDHDAHMLRPGWGFANLVANFRNRSAARLMDAKTANVEAWTRFLHALDGLTDAMINRERGRRRLENLDEILDAEEAYENIVTMYERKTNLAEAKKRLRDAERALDRVDGASEPKERKKADRLDRLEETIAEKRRIMKKGDEIVRNIIAEAKAAGVPEDDKELRREVENVQDEIKRMIAAVNERG